jgi:hypothetical protein
LASQRILAPPRQRLDLIAEPLDVVQRSSLVAALPLLLSWLSRPQTLLRLVHLLAQLVETLADACFRSIGIRVNPPAQPISSPLRPVRQIGLIHPTQGVTQF